MSESAAPQKVHVDALARRSVRFRKDSALRPERVSASRRSVMRAKYQRVASVWMLCGLWIVPLAAAGADLRLVDAAKTKDWEAVGVLVHENLDVNTPQADGATALHWAAHWNDLETLELLINAGANVSAENDLGATPLWVACANRHTGIVQRLLEAGSSPNMGLRSGETLLMRCTHTGVPAAVRALLAHGADVRAIEPSRGQTALMWAAANGHPDVTRVLLEHGAAVAARTTAVRQLRGTGERSTTSPAGATNFSAGGFTPLLFAARHGDVGSARLLLDAGADVNTAAADGNSALVVAAMSGHGRLSEFLLEKGADPDASGAGYTALHAGISRSDPALVKALLAKGANPNARLTKGTPVPRWTYQFILTAREKGATPFMLAAKYLEPEIMRLLAAAGADPLLPMDDGTTALMAAVGLGLNRSTNRRSRLIAPELVAAEWANEGRVLDTVKAAVEAGAAAAINETGRAGNTALHGAARNRFRTVAEFLVTQGGDLDIKNEDDSTPRELLDRLDASQ